MMSDLLEYVRNLYYTMHGWYIVVGLFVFIIVYGMISYLGASHTTTPPLNMGIPVANYTGEYWATYIANVAISVPLTIIIIWLFLHLIKVVFKIDLVMVIKQLFSGSNPMHYLITTADAGLERAEVNTAKFIHSLKTEVNSAVKPYKKSEGKESFSTLSMNQEQEEVGNDAPVAIGGGWSASYGSVEDYSHSVKNTLKKLN
jgi:hypothetical protein